MYQALISHPHRAAYPHTVGYIWVYSILSIIYNLLTLTCTVPRCPFSSSRLVPVTVIRSPRLSGKEGGKGSAALPALPIADPALSVLRPVAPGAILRDASGFSFIGFTTGGRGGENTCVSNHGDETPINNINQCKETYPDEDRATNVTHRCRGGDIGGTVGVAARRCTTFHA